MNCLFLKINRQLILIKNLEQQEANQPAEKLQEYISNFNISEFRSITDAFLYLTTCISKQIQNKDFGDIKRACIAQANTPGGAQLSDDMKKSVRTSKDLNALLDILVDSPYWSWIDLRLLRALVVASGSRAALNLIEAYENQVFSKKLLEVISCIPDKEVSDDHYEKIKSKFGKNLEEITIKDLLELKSKLETVIMDLKSGTCALARIIEGCIEIHWIIPIDYVDHAYNAASLKRHQYHALHLQYLQIGAYEKIYDPSILHSSHLVATELPLPVGAGKNTISLVDS